MNSPSDSLRRSTRALALALALWTASSAALVAASVEDFVFTYRNGDTEWASSGDFNGDGLLDAVIVDRATGAYRIGYQSPGGEHTWTAPRASGVADVRGFSVGRLFNAAQHGLAFTAEAANRVNVVPADLPSQAGLPVSVFVPSVGPNQVVALDIGGAGNTALQDLIVMTAWNGAAPYRSTTVRNADGAAFTTLQDLAASERLERGNRVVIKDGTPAVLAVVARGQTDTLRLVSYAGGPANTFLEITNLAGGSEYAVGRFAGTGLRHILTFRPGQSNLWSHPVLEPVPGTFAVGAAAGFAFDDAIESVVTLPGPASTKVLVLFHQGTHAAAYHYDGTNNLVLAGEFLPPEGESLLGATPLENHGVRVHSGTGKTLSAEVVANSLDGRTSHSHQYSFNAGSGTYALERTDSLPAVTDLSGQANVYQYQSEPFVATAPRLLHSGHAGDWSSRFSIAGGPPQVGVISETFVDATHGLDDPTPASLGATHPLAQFGLVNQYIPSVSLFSLAPGLGAEVVELSAQPAGGLYARSVAVRFVTGSPGFQVLYRLNPAGAWLTYSGSPVFMFTNSVLQFRARSILGASTQTSIHRETYTFKEKPGTLDSDSDGVPDHVEIAHGLNPLGGSDTDGDGYSDFEELLKNTSPSNPASHPGTAGYEQHAAVDWVLRPRPIDGTTGAETAARSGGRVQVFDLSGSSLAAGLVRGPLAGALASTAVATNVFLDPSRPLLVAATDLHYDIVTPSPDARLGRELVALLPSPAVAPLRVDYAYGSAGGALNAEALNWVAAAQAAYHAATNEVRFQTLSVARTTAAALFEEKLRIVVAAAAPDRTNLTLFAFRDGDAGRQRFDEDVRDLLVHGDATRPAYDLRQMLRAVETLAITAPNSRVQALQAVAETIYRVSSALNNAAPGRYRPPFDVLRDFIRHGVLHSNYVSTGLFPAPVLADAIVGAQSVLDNVGSRPLTNLTLRIRPDTFDGPCTTLETANLAMTPVHLFALGGGAFDFPDTFELLAGTVVEVVGRPDMPSTTCAGLNVEVLAISLQAIPARSDGDADGNLLIDSWEKLFLGGVGGDPFGDDDGDGYSNLQEMLDGTDPRDGLGVPPGAVVDMKIPALQIEPSAGGGLALEWFWPEAYLGRVQFQIVATTDLNVAPTARTIQAVHVGGGVQRAIVPNPGGTQFFKVALRLQF